jgi:uncharacterized protein DUF1707/2TM domain-containing protein
MAPHHPDTRVSDAEREKLAQTLREHAAQGRLSVDELSERLDRAYAARTEGELSALIADLPSVPPRGRVGGPALQGELAAYVAVNLMLIVIWAVTGAGYFWPIWPLLGWGIGLVTGIRGIGPCRRLYRPVTRA